MNNRSIFNNIDFDYLNKEEQDQIRRVLLFKLYKHALNHPYLKKRVSSLTNRVTSDNITDIWLEIPCINSEDHADFITNYAEEIKAHIQGKSASIVFSSGGTSDFPKSIWISFEEMMRNTLFHGKGYQTAGITEKDTVATFGLPGILSSHFTMYLGLERTGCIILPIGSIEDPCMVIELVERLKATVLLAMPSDIVPLVDQLEKDKKILSNIRLIVTGGEPLRDTQKSRFSKFIGQDNILYRSTFQTSDAGTIGFQCPYCAPNEYHVHEELQYVELVPFSDETKYNEIVITNFDHYLMPVIRIKTGDLAEWSNKPCQCGRTIKTLRLLGRTHRFKKIGGEKFDTAVFEKLPKLFDISLNKFAVKIERNKKQQDKIIFCLPKECLNDNTLKTKISTFILNNSKNLNKQIKAGIISQFDFVEIAKGDIKLSPSGKRIVVIDQR